MTFCGPARDTILTNQQTEKLNFDTNYITITIGHRRRGDYKPYYIHFEINGVSCNLIGSQECDFSTNRTARSAIRAEIAPSFNQSH